MNLENYSATHGIKKGFLIENALNHDYESSIVFQAPFNNNLMQTTIPV